MNSTNSSTSDIVHDSTTLGVAYTLISISVVVANGLTIYVIGKAKELQRNEMWMLSFRAISDFSYGLYYLIFLVPSALLNRFAYPDSVIGLSFCIISLLNGQTVFNIALTVIDRCIAVIKPLAYEQIVSKRNFILAVLLSISINVIRLFMIVFPDVDYYYNADMAVCVVDFDTRMSVFAAVGIPIITFFIIVITSCVIAVEMRRAQGRIFPSGINENRSKLPIMVMMSVAVFCVSYSPIVVFVFWNLIGKIENVPIILSKIGMICLLSNSLWNVFIYTATFRPFRKALMHRMCPFYYREQRRNDLSL